MFRHIFTNVKFLLEKNDMLHNFIRNFLIIVAAVTCSICAIFGAMLFSTTLGILTVQTVYFYLYVSISAMIISLGVLYFLTTKKSEDMELFMWLIQGMISTFLLVALLTYMLITTFKDEFI